MNNSIEKDFDTLSLLRFALPSMIMMVFMSMYTVVDGVFIAHFIGDDGLSAINLVYPAISFVIAIGIMLATGGSAVVARQMGQGKRQQARESFTFLSIVALLFAVVTMIAGNVWLTPLVRLMGSTEALQGLCESYLSVMLLFAPACVMQIMYQTFFVTASRPTLGLATTMIGGVANAVLDYVLMGPLDMGIAGAALATGIGQSVPAVVGAVYFLFYRKNLYYVKTGVHGGVLAESCLNGSSEMVTNLATSVVTYLFNIVMLRLVGERGVAAISVVLYGQFLFNALFMGYAMGVAPVISFNYGSQNHVRLYRIFRICMIFVGCASLGITGLALLSSRLVIGIFTTPGGETFEIALHGFKLFALNFLFAGVNIFTSAMYTALSDGKRSAFISFLRTFGFLVLCILTLPMLLEVDGVWLSVPLAEALTVVAAGILLALFARKEQAILRQAKN